MKTLLFLLALTTGMFFACKNNSGVKEETNLSVEHHDAVKQNHDDHPSHATKVTLNAGNKWQANAETTEGIKNMMAHLDRLPQSPTVDDYNTLKMDLDKEFATILQKCTMTGEAHNQLHNYLLPMKEMIDALGTGSPEASHASVSALKQYLSEYAEYFQ